jgi:hypothetical protein
MVQILAAVATQAVEHGGGLPFWSIPATGGATIGLGWFVLRMTKTLAAAKRARLSLLNVEMGGNGNGDGEAAKPASAPDGYNGALCRLRHEQIEKDRAAVTARMDNLEHKLDTGFGGVHVRLDHLIDKLPDSGKVRT